MRRRLILLPTFAVALAAAAGPRPMPSLPRADLDPALVLPPPPVAGSPEAKAELAELHAVERSRTPAEAAAARAEGEIKDASIFAEAIGPRFDLARLSATAALMALVKASSKDVIDRGKDEFRRPRPWIVDPTLATCKRNEEGPLTSYPSGHTTRAYAYAGVLARLLPAHASAILSRAQGYAETRITCEQHFRSDVTAGEALGLLIAERLSAKPEFRSAYEKADLELSGAGLRD